MSCTARERAARLAFLLGGLLTLVFTMSQAELGAALPLAGGDYATIGYALGPRTGFIQFGLVLFGTPVFLAVTTLYHAFVLDKRADGWTLFSVPSEGSAL